MAAAIGKLTILVGAGVVGTILSKDGGFSDVTKFFSGAFKIVTKHLQQDKHGSGSTGKQQNDSLLAQVNNLRQELQLLASSRSVTVVTVGRTGSRTYGVVSILVIGVVGYCFIWWKGWKLTDMMFVTRRNFSKACSSVTKQLDTVSSSVSSVRQFLSSRIDRVDITLDETVKITMDTKNEVGRLHGELSDIHGGFESIYYAVQDLELKLNRIEGSQDSSTRGIYQLMKIVEHLEKRSVKAPQSAFRQSIEASPNPITIRNMAALPPAPEPTSPSSSTKVLFSSRTVSVLGLKKLQETSNLIVMAASASRPSLDKASAPETPNSSRFGWKLPSIGVLARSRSSLG